MELTPGLRYAVVVKSIVKAGAVVSLEDGTTELIHVSNISDEFVRDANDYVCVGDELVAVCEAGKVKPAELSIKNLKLVNRSSNKGTSSSKGMYGGLANPSCGFSDATTPTDNTAKSGSVMSCEEKNSALDDMIKKSKQDLKSKLYFNRKKKKKAKGRRSKRK